MPGQPLVSIGIPNYNYGRFLGACIDSVLRQTYENIECVVVDNASTDDSMDVIRSFRDPRLRFLRHTRTIPMYANWNAAWGDLRGELVKLLPSDDVMDPSYVRECLDLMVGDVDMVLVGTKIIDAAGQVVQALADGMPEFAGGPLRGPAKMAAAYRLSRFVPVTNWLFRKEVLPYFSFDFIPSDYERPVSLDFIFWCHLLVNSRAVYGVPRPLAVTRVHDRNERFSCDNLSTLHEQLVGIFLMKQYAALDSHALFDGWADELSSRYLLTGIRLAVEGEREKLLRTLRFLKDHRTLGAGLRRLPGAFLRWCQIKTAQRGSSR